VKAPQSYSHIFTAAVVAMAVVAFSGLDVRMVTRADAAKSETQAIVPPPKDTAMSEARRLNDEFTALADAVSVAVVNVYTKSQGNVGRRSPHPSIPEEQFEYFFGNPFRSPPREALGSGFVIDAKEGFIVTNAHVVRMAGKNADEIMIKFKDETNGRGHPAKVVGADEATDVALLKLVNPVPGLKELAMGDSDKARVGEWVLAVGNPYGHTNTVTQGIVSALGRSLEGLRAEFMQTSASINPGNSGGPLVNMSGEVIAINTAMDPRAQGIGFAIPVNVAKRVVEQLKESGKVTRPWMGIAIADVSEDIAGYMKLKNVAGVLVREVMPGQPAAKAGLKPYDIITRVDGKQVRSTRELFQAMDKLDVGKTIEVQVLRDNQPRELKVELGQS
jgi:serine protease Do